MGNRQAKHGQNSGLDVPSYPTRKSIRLQALAEATRANESPEKPHDVAVSSTLTAVAPASTSGQDATHPTIEAIKRPQTRRELRQQAIVKVSRRSLREQVNAEALDCEPMATTGSEQLPTTKRDLLEELPVAQRSTLDITVADTTPLVTPPPATRAQDVPATFHQTVRKPKSVRGRRRQGAIDHLTATQSIKIQPMPSMVSARHATPAAQEHGFKFGVARRLTVLAVSAGVVLTGAVPAYAVDPVVAASVKPGESVDQAILAVQAALVSNKSTHSQTLSMDGTDFAPDSDPEVDYQRDNADANGPVELNEPRVNVACKVPEVSGADVHAPVVIPVPVGSFNLTSPVGERWGRWHNGQDFAAHLGTSIVAAQSGTVVGVGFFGSNPYIAILDEKMSDGKQYGTIYEHMPPSSIRVKVGDTVRAGEEIALVGNEGQSTGPHLHFEVHDVTDDPTVKFLGVKTHIQPVAWLKQYSAVGLNGC